MLLSPKKVPAYIREILSRSGFEFDHMTTHPNFVQGYTIYIRKRTPNTSVHTFRKEIEQFCSWADRTAGSPVSHILHVPYSTLSCDQFAQVTILDPIMLQIEDYIKH